MMISPATTNKNLRFQGEFENTFWPCSLRSAFEGHPAFNAVFLEEEPSSAEFKFPPRRASCGCGGSKKKFPGKIVSLSEDGAAATPRVTGKCADTADEAVAPAAGADFALTRASKGLVSVIMTAYNRHCNLVLSPDDVWLTILAQFCAYVNKNAEGLRNRIVQHEGKTELTAYGSGSVGTADYVSMIRDLLVEIRNKIKSPELADWFRPGFSTTAEKDEVCAAATAMASLQAYFEFKMQIRCGIPSVTMLGTTADWKLLREKIERLLEFEVQGNSEGNVMELWVGYLRKVCDGFVESAEHPDSAKTLEFWDKIVSHRGGGSGSRSITGWLTTFTCFDQHGKFLGKRKDDGGGLSMHMRTDFIGEYKSEGGDFPLIDVDDICHNVVSCPVKIDDNGVEYDGTLFVGQVAFEAEQDGPKDYPTVRPRNDWCMAVAVKE